MSRHTHGHKQLRRALDEAQALLDVTDDIEVRDAAAKFILAGERAAMRDTIIRRQLRSGGRG